MSPTQLTRGWLKKRGITSDIVEKWNSFARKKQDLLGFGDILAVSSRIIAIQTTSGDHVAHRIQKIYAEPRAREWLNAGGLIEVHGWRKCGARGKRKVWSLRRVAIEVDGMGAMVSREVEDE